MEILMYTARANQIIAKCLIALSKSEKPRSKVAYSVLDWVNDELYKPSVSTILTLTHRQKSCLQTYRVQTPFIVIVRHC